MNINQLRYFVSAANLLNFTKAASQFYISQTAMTQQIQALERELEVTLFDRNTRPIRLTPAGEVFLYEAKNILLRTDSAIRKTKDATTGFVGELCIGYTKGYERSNLSDKLRIFHKKYPNILFTCMRTDTDSLAEGLLSDNYDIIFSWDSTNLMNDDAIEYTILEHSPLFVAVNEGHRFENCTMLHRSDLRDEVILYMSPSKNGRSFGDNRFLELYRQAGFEPNILLTSNDVESILIMVAAEEGISILPGYAIEKLTNAEHLSFIPLIGEGEYEDIIAAWKKNNSNPALIHFLEDFF